MVEEFGKYYVLMCNHYDKMKKQFSASYKRATGESFDVDVFHDTLIKCAETLNEAVMSSMSEEELINYTYMAFKTNMYRDKQYARNKYRVDIEMENCKSADDYADYWNMRCVIRDFIVDRFGEDTFEECCQWIIDRKSVKEIEREHNDKNLYYKFKKIKKLVLENFGDDLFDIPTN